MCEIVNGCSPADTAPAQCREVVPRPVRRTPVFPGGRTAAVGYLPPEKLSPTPQEPTPHRRRILQSVETVRHCGTRVQHVDCLHPRAICQESAAKTRLTFRRNRLPAKEYDTSSRARTEQSMNPLRSLSNALQRKNDLNDELESHLKMAVAARVAQGETPERARTEAIREFGNVPMIADVTREGWGWLRLEHTLQDLRYALRILAHERSFTVVAVLILALGIGANIVVFSVVNTILLRPLPFQNAQQLVWIAGNNGVGGLSDTAYRVDWWEAYRRYNHSLQNVTGFVPYLTVGETKLMNHGEPKPVSGVWVLQDFFPTLSVHPVLGRQFAPEEAIKGGRPVVMLSYPFWQRQFNADPAMIGQTITLGKEQRTVVGVLPPSFDFGAVFAPGTKMDYFIPAVPDDIRNWGHVFSLVGRLKPGVTVAQAQTEANILFPQLRHTLKLDGDTDYKTTLTGLKDEVSGKLWRSLEVLWAAVGLILLIVCVNLSNLLLARAATRSKEFSL